MIHQVPVVQLGDVVELRNGFAFESSQFSTDPDDVPLVKGSNLGHREIAWHEGPWWPKGDAETHDKFRLTTGDVVVAMDRPIVGGKLKYAWLSERDPDGLLVQRVCRLRGTEQLDQRYLRYVIGSPAFQAHVERITTGVNVPHISGGDIQQFTLPLPSLEVQQRIADILVAYDDLIENNNRRMALQEEAIHLLYREWFVSLRFPGHDRVEVVDGVPDGWSRATLSEVCESIEDGDWIESKDQGGEAYRLLQVSNIGVGRFVETGNFRYVTDETFRRLNCREVVAGDVLVSRMPDPIGRAWLVTDMPFKMITAVDVAILKAGVASSPLFLSCHLNSPSSLALAEAKATGATRARISRRVLSDSPILAPPEPLVRSFDETVGPLHRQAVLLEKQNQRLREARDLLLPRLMNGSIVV
jgi:type I restriction enzyme S subunit